MNRTSATLMIAAALSCAGCLDFDRQTIHAIFPEGQDELHAVFIYEGLNVSGTKKDDTKLAQQQLKELVEGKSFYLLNNFLRFSLVEKGDDAQGKKLHELVSKHLSIQGGVLFLDDKTNLNACQTVRIRKLNQFVVGLNEVIAAEFARESEKQRANLTGDFYDLETLDLIDKAIRDRHVWLKCEPGRLSFTMPASAAVITKVKRILTGADDVAGLDAQAQELNPEKFLEFKKALADVARNRKELADLPWSFQQERNRFTISLGVGESEPLHLPLGSRSRSQTWEGELVTFAKEAQLPIRKDATVKSLIEKLQREVKESRK